MGVISFCSCDRVEDVRVVVCGYVSEIVGEDKCLNGLGAWVVVAEDMEGILEEAT